jgi:hypothetical protein
MRAISECLGAMSCRGRGVLRGATVASLVVCCLGVAAAPAAAASAPVTVCTSGTDVISHDQTWSATQASAYLIGCTVEVAHGATLTIQKETVVKFGLGGNASEIYVAPGGRLSAEGCPQPPHIPGQPWHPVPCPTQRIVFTTVYDNSVGGTTAPPGTSGSDFKYPEAVVMDGQSSVYVDYAAVRHAANTVVDGDPLVIAGCAATGGESLTVTDTTLVAPVSVGQCDGTPTASRYDISGDTFALAAGLPGLALNGKPADRVVASGDRFYYVGSAPTKAIMTNEVPVQGITLAGSSSSAFSSSGPVSVDLQNGSVPAGDSWSFASPDGVPLAGQIAVAGTAVMSAGARLNDAQLTLDPTGRLAVPGSAADPVVFQNRSSIDLTGAGELTVSHAIFPANPSAGIMEQGCLAHGNESVRIESSAFYSPVDLGNCDSGGGDNLVVAQNHFAVPDRNTALAIAVPELNGSQPGTPGKLNLADNVFAPPAVKLTQAGPPEVTVYGWPVQGIVLTGSSANRFEGNDNGRVLGLIAATLPLGASWTVDPRSGAILDPQTEYFFGNPGLAVEGRLVLDPGTIVKIGVGAVQGGGLGVGYGIGLADLGTLVAHGTAAQPVLFTSMNDSSAGGSSYGIPTTATQKDYIWAVGAAEGSTVQVSHATFRHGLYAFQMDCGVPPEPGGGFDLTDSVIQDEVSLGNCSGAAESYTPVLQHDLFPFAGAPSGNFASGGGYDPSALQPAILLYNVDPTGVDLAGSESNDFDGSGAGRVVALAGTEIPSGEHWTVSGTSRAVLAAWPDTDYLKPPAITLDGDLTLNGGTIIKSGIGGIIVDVKKTGDLAFGGPASDPVVFTAVSDDSVGGDSNGDGSASHPSTGAYGTAIQFDHLTANMPISNTVFKYASDALSYLYMQHDSGVSHSDFVHNQAAVEVEETSGPDYNGLGNLPCFPPWIFGVNADSDWFGPHGWPAPDIDLASVVGAVLPGDIPYEGSAFNYSGVGDLIDQEHLNFGDGNTVPWAIYSCAKVPLPIPLSAVGVNGPAHAPNYPTVEQSAVLRASAADRRRRQRRP